MMSNSESGSNFSASPPGEGVTLHCSKITTLVAIDIDVFTSRASFGKRIINRQNKVLTIVAWAQLNDLHGWFRIW